MILLIVISLLLTAINCSVPKVEKTCDNSLVDVRSFKIDGNKVSKGAVMRVNFTVQQQFQKDDKIIVEVSMYKEMFSWIPFWIPLPSFMFRKIVENVELPEGVQYLSDNRFEADCRAVTWFIKECPPKRGENYLEYDFQYIFAELEQVKSKAGPLVSAALSWFASGDYKVAANVKLADSASLPGKELACLEIDFPLEA